MRNRVAVANRMFRRLEKPQVMQLISKIPLNFMSALSDLSGPKTLDSTIRTFLFVKKLFGLSRHRRIQIGQ